VANGELCPVVVSFSPAMRAQLRLAKRYKHTRIFVETNDPSRRSTPRSCAKSRTRSPRCRAWPLTPRVAFARAARGLCSRPARPPGDTG
jgi:hypothetical protein